VKFICLFLFATAAYAQSVTCPSIIKVTDPRGRMFEHKYERISVFSGDSDLVPDDEKKAGVRLTQMWFLSGYRDMHLFVRCRYTGTNGVVDLDLPEAVKTCTQRFNIDRAGKISGPFEMECR
jgi:hypothetical protein